MRSYFDLAAGVLEQERSGAIGALSVARLEGALTKEGCLLIAGDPGDWQVKTQERFGHGFGQLAVARDDSR